MKAPGSRCRATFSKAAVPENVGNESNEGKKQEEGLLEKLWEDNEKESEARALPLAALVDLGAGQGEEETDPEA